MARIVLAMSGGVDSSVAAWLLTQQGHEVIGLFMRHGVPGRPVAAEGERTAQGPTGGYDGSSPPKAPFGPAGADRNKGCCSAADAADARRVAETLGIPFYALNFEDQFGRIVDYFVDEYLAGRTPNPCIVCNTWLKFGKLFEYADSVGAEYVATGHHARILPAPGEPHPALCRGRDPAKDQSYVLFGVERGLLGRLSLPVGQYSKPQIRQIASRLGLPVAEKPDSQEICFVPDQDHARFVRRQRPAVDTSGEIVTTDGTVVGRHAGLEHFTVGQRKGLAIALGKRCYVIRLEPQTRRVVVGPAEQLARRELLARQANWLVDPPPGPFRCEVKIRYRSPAVPATVYPLGAERFRVEFDRACPAVTPGQAAVCYQAERVLGGGWIEA